MKGLSIRLYLYLYYIKKQPTFKTFYYLKSLKLNTKKTFYPLSIIYLLFFILPNDHFTILPLCFNLGGPLSIHSSI